MARTPRIIKKYANRRLYDTETSQSITLNDVARLIGQGADIQVVEAKGGQDITRSVLLQIVADQEMLGQPMLSDAFLMAIIRLSANPASELARDFLERAVTGVEQASKSAGLGSPELFRQWFGHWYTMNDKHDKD
ncbi:MAG: polyhydroxyalkanoate synthesis repressor PhaR [Wenzhouxiangella sp.]